MMAAKMFPLCALPQTSSPLIQSAPTGSPQTAVHVYQTQSVYANNLFEGQPHPPSPQSPLPLQRQAVVLVAPFS